MVEAYEFATSEVSNIAHSYKALQKVAREKLSLTEEEEKLIEDSFSLAHNAHRFQRRKSGEPYILHPLEVAKICCQEINLGATSIACALLHDVVEDTAVTLEEIDAQFGKEMSTIVNGLTKLDGTYKTISIQAENFKKILGTLVYDVRVILIKMADRLHNLRTIDSLPKNKKLKIASETRYIYSPLAHRLGLYNIKSEFEDLCLKIIDPPTYQEITRKISDNTEEREQFIKQFIAPLKKSLDEAGIANRIYGRIKAISSIYNKIRTKHVTFEEVYDMFAIRVVIDVPVEEEKSTCWRAYSIITDNYKPVSERLRDWISVPKSNGYESLHTTIVGPKGKFVEVQIRTERMEEIAEKGYATHWKYKGLRNFEGFDDWLDNIKDIIENKDSSSLEFLSDFKTNLFNEEVYAYTPKGDMKVLPKGATALDFAFSIHSDIGYHATAIKVNSKLVPMGYALQNGDQVHVTTNKSQRPSESWLKMVVTGKARSKIRSAMKEERKKQGQIGRETLERKLRNIKADFSESNVDTFAKFLKFKSHVDLYFAISQDQINVTESLKNFNVEGGKLVEIEEKPEKIEKPPSPTPSTQSTTNKDHSPTELYINGESAHNLDYQFATCCNPVPGDDIFAYLSNNGLKIHRNSCPNATNLAARYGYRIMRADWTNITNTNFVANLIITGVDTGIGVIEAISQKISSGLGVNIRKFNIESNEGIYECTISLQVKDTAQLGLVIKTLKEIDGVSRVTRSE